METIDFSDFEFLSDAVHYEPGVYAEVERFRRAADIMIARFTGDLDGANLLEEVDRADRGGWRHLITYGTWRGLPMTPVAEPPPTGGWHWCTALGL